MARTGADLPVPVLCVGNLVAGGAGKTPTALALADLLIAGGHRPAFLSRGYGRRVPASARHVVLRVEPGRHDADAAGDEPLLLAALAPTYVAADRLAAGRRAIADGATVLVLDDGLQNPRLRKTAAIAVVDGRTGIGNGLCLPAGPLRAPVARQWPAVTAVCVIGPGAPGAALAADAARRGTTVLQARLVPDRAVLAGLAATPLVAFAGIGRPEKFFNTLSEAGLDVVERIGFPDHHAFTDHDRAMLLTRAGGRGAQLVTTGKDRVRLPRDFPAVSLPVTLAFDDPALATCLIATWLDGPRADPAVAATPPAR